MKDRLAIAPESVDLIYLDPPFNSKSEYNLAFKNHDKSLKPVAAFKDTWQWGEQQDETLEELRSRPQTEPIAKLVDVAKATESPSVQYRLDAYLINMAERLILMKNTLKPTGSIYLHCDPTASHYLKALLDVIFGKDNFRNEIIWRIGWVSGYKTQKKGWIRNHDTILYYLKSEAAKGYFNKEYIPHAKDYRRRDGKKPTGKGIPIEDTWNCSEGDKLDSIMIKSFSREKLGYPTQKSLALLERIIKASTNLGDLVLDPFCGCGTTVHAAEALGRRWIGIDIARFSTGLVKNRLLSNFKEKLQPNDIKTYGIPETVAEARELVAENPFEFEKWACGHVGAGGMFQNKQPGEKGADQGVDGALIFWPAMPDEKPKAHLAIIQVKGGKVTSDNVRALKTTVDNFNATAGILVCFRDQMATVENNRSMETFSDVANKKYPVIQGLSVEDMLQGDSPNLPNIMRMADEDVKSRISSDNATERLL